MVLMIKINRTVTYNVRLFFLGPVHTYTFTFVNVYFYFRLGLPSTRKRDVNGYFRKRCPKWKFL